MRRCLVLGTFLVGAAGAAPTAPIGYDRVLDLIDTAQKRVLLYAPQLTDVRLANALRIKVAQNVPVVVVTVPFFSFRPESTSNALALVGARVYEAQVNATGSVLVIDDKTFSGQGFGRTAAGLTYLGNSPATTNATVNWFRATTGAGKRLSLFDAADRIRGMQK